MLASRVISFTWICGVNWYRSEVSRTELKWKKNNENDKIIEKFRNLTWKSWRMKQKNGANSLKHLGEKKKKSCMALKSSCAWTKEADASGSLNVLVVFICYRPWKESAVKIHSSLLWDEDQTDPIWYHCGKCLLKWEE